MKTIAILDNNRDVLDKTVQSVFSLGYYPAGFYHPATLLNYASDTQIQLLIVGETVSADRATMQFLSRLRDQHSNLPVIVIGPNAARYCAHSGFHALAQPFTQSTLDQTINAALAQPVALPAQ